MNLRVSDWNLRGIGSDLERLRGDLHVNYIDAPLVASDIVKSQLLLKELVKHLGVLDPPHKAWLWIEFKETIAGRVKQDAEFGVVCLYEYDDRDLLCPPSFTLVPAEQALIYPSATVFPLIVVGTSEFNSLKFRLRSQLALIPEDLSKDRPARAILNIEYI